MLWNARRDDDYGCVSFGLSKESRCRGVSAVGKAKTNKPLCLLLINIKTCRFVGQLVSV